MNLIVTHGPVEPRWTRMARNAYWRHHIWVGRLEARICRTDSGLEWLMRVKQIGKAAG